MKYQNENDYLATPDMPLIATLICYGYLIDSVDKRYEKAQFLIPRNKALDSLIRQYHAHELRVDPLSYFYALKEVKNRLYNN